jgi:putative membrane protein
MRSHIIMAALLVAPGAALLAQDTSATQTPQRDTIRGYNNSWQNSQRHDSLQGDNALVMKIHKINQMEIQAGQQLVRDHQAADKKITTLAQGLGVTFPPEGMKAGTMGQDTAQARDGQRDDGMQEQQQLQRLSTLQGGQFDAEFANFMAQGHDKAIKMLEQAQSTVQNAQLRTFITSTLPTLRTHLQVAQSLGGSTTATTSASSQ